MKIERLAIQGYRSLYDVSLEPGDLTVLTGPNNSGKTNLVEAVDFLAETYRHGPETAVNRKGGIENIAHRRMRRTRTPTSFDVEVHFEPEELRQMVRAYGANRRGVPSRHLGLRHRFAISASSQAIEADFMVEEETIHLIDGVDTLAPQTLLLIKRRQEEVSIEDYTPPRDRALADLLQPLNEKAFADYLVSRPVGSINLLIRSMTFSEILRIYTMLMGRTRLYQLVPLECRRPGVPTPNAELDRHGDNLPALVAHLKRHDPRAWVKMLEAMRRIVPGLADVRTGFTPDRRLSLQFVEDGVRRPWSSEDISDGTIQSLALFAALYDRRSSLVLIEEPENSVHPWIVRVFVDACRQVRGKQIIITTHSPALINYLRPEEVSLVWRRSGRTHLEPLTKVDENARTVWAEGKATVFELLDSGLLPETVPEEPE